LVENIGKYLMRVRRALAYVAGGVAYTVTLYRFLSYSERNRLPLDTYVVLGALALGIGFLVAFGLTSRRYATPGFAILGVWTAHAIVVWMDLRKDPTDHNLLPFEFIILGVCAMPAYLGAALAHLVDYIRAAVRASEPPPPP
jgi:hypothetical protein